MQLRPILADELGRDIRLAAALSGSKTTLSTADSWRVCAALSAASSFLGKRSALVTVQFPL